MIAVEHDEQSGSGGWKEQHPVLRKCVRIQLPKAIFLAYSVLLLLVRAI